LTHNINNCWPALLFISVFYSRDVHLRELVSFELCDPMNSQSRNERETLSDEIYVVNQASSKDLQPSFNDTGSSDSNDDVDYVPSSLKRLHSSSNSLGIATTSNQPSAHSSSVNASSINQQLTASSVHNISSNTDHSNKRKRCYTYRNRNVKQKKESKRHTKWMEYLSMTDNEIRGKICCSTMKCFQKVNLSRFRQTMACVFTSNRKTRLHILQQMLASS